MKKFLSAAAVLILLCVPRVGDAYEPHITKRVLKSNGLTVVIQEMPNNPMVSVYVLVKAGSATEDKFLGTGLSHFLEHMLFKGTEKRGVGQIPAEIQAVGGSLNASTSMDFTIYTINVPYTEFETGLDVVTDMVLNSVLDPEEVAKEREVVFNEMRLINDRPQRRLTRMVYETMFTVHPYYHPIIGYKDLLAQISRDEMWEYYKSRYFINNMVLAIAGNVKAEEIMPMIEEKLKDYPRKPYLVRNLPQEPDQVAPRRVEEYFETDVTRLTVAYPSVRMLNHDVYALDVLAQVLGEGESSRLYKDLFKDRTLVSWISAGNYTPVDKGVFDITATLEDEDNVEEVIEGIRDHIARIKAKGITADELAKAQTQVLSDFIFGNQTTQRVAWFMAYDEAFTGDPAFTANYVKGIEDVTTADIKRVANEYLKPQTESICILRPNSSRPEKSATQSDAVLQQIHREVLPNGITLLTLENPQFEVVTVRMNIRGGVNEEPEELSGLSNIMATAWAKETKSRSAQALAELKDSRGISLSGSSGRTSNGVYVDCLSRDWDLCLDLLRDVTFNPTFPQKEIDLQRQNLLVHLKQRDKEIFRLSNFHLKQNLFSRNPIRLDGAGTPESLPRITRDDVTAFYRKILTPRDMVISVFGDIDAEAVTEKIRKDFGKMEGGEYMPAMTELAPPAGEKRINLNLEKEQAIVQFGFRAVGFMHPDYYKIDVMTSILGSSFSGRLFTKVRNVYGKAYTLGGNVSATMDAGYIYFYVITDAESLEDVEKLVREELQRMKDEVVPEGELEDIKHYLKGDNASSLQTVSQQNSRSNLNELYGLGYDYHTRYDEFVDAVTQEDVQAMARQYLDFDNMVSVFVRPAKDKE
ncbi:MAG: insulinase family protein [Candidatus Omnitrophica bacterium]|nr:insulinase family protein [Candidatus Omnitrophota bacterium]